MLQRAFDAIATPADPLPVSFADVFAGELNEISRRRQALYQQRGDPRFGLVGLALSGGGIRSATFSLGILQGLYRLGLVRLFDYLSTVSGGGFVGAWWSSWLSRQQFDAFGPDDVREPRALAVALLADGLVAADSEIARRLRDLRAVDEQLVEANEPMKALRLSLIDELDEMLGEADLLARVPQGPHTIELEKWWIDVVKRGDPVDSRRTFNALLLWTIYSPALASPVFPPLERVEPERAQGYVDPAVSDSALAAGDDPIHHLRLFSNYITPRKGLLSPDTWRAVAVVTRNLLLTWLILIPTLVSMILVAQLYYVIQPFDDHVVIGFTGYSPADFLLSEPSPPAAWTRGLVAARPAAWIMLVLLFLTVIWMGLNDAGVVLTRVTALLTVLVMTICGAWMLWPASQADRDLLGRIETFLVSADGLMLVLPLGAAIYVAWRVFRLPGEFVTDPSGPKQQVRANRATGYHAELLVGLVLVTVVLAFAGFSHDVVAPLVHDIRVSPLATGRQFWSLLVVVVTIFGSIFTALKASPVAGHDQRELGMPSLFSRLIFTATPPLVVVVLGAGAAWVALEILRGVLEDFDRRLVPLTLAALAGVVFCLVLSLYEFYHDLPGKDLPRQWRRWASLAVLSVALWALICYLSIDLNWVRARTGLPWAGEWYQAGLAIAGGLLFSLPTLRRTRRGVGGLAAFAVAILLALHAGAHRVLDVLIGSHAGLRSDPFYVGCGLIAVLGALVVTLGWMADPNALSLHTFYKARLVRAYLGASNFRRRHERLDITETGQGDDLRLADLTNCRNGGPYHLVNTTLNLVGGRDLTTAQRSAVPFLLSSLYCGSVRTGYRETAKYMAGEMTLGAAMAASGAAVSPTMGSRTPTAALAMLLAFLNVRLGLWVPAPNKSYWLSPQTRLWPFYLLRECVSKTNDAAAYCYLTDGGHFDNTGLYALVERACRFIVLVDNGADPEPCFEDLGDAIRRCRIDFGAEIELPVTAFRRTEAYQINLADNAEAASVRRTDGRSARAHYAVGHIKYCEPHLRTLGWVDYPEPWLTGVIVWFKPAIVTDESVDVRQYALQNPMFPQQTTVNQWFDESQFESYRKLGEFCAEQAFRTLDSATLLRRRETIRAEDVEGTFREVYQRTEPTARKP